jgi:hypothetical protein
MMRRFELHRSESGGSVEQTGIIAEGVAFYNGLGEETSVAVKLACTASVVFRDQGVSKFIHDQEGRVDSRLVWLDSEVVPCPAR